ncbi:MAG: hypothetical protein Q8761_03105 [Sweet potato little leaf phytoplasma]|nr:hypothetical protein [Sweet potato little leaf phytoplasma]
MRFYNEEVKFNVFKAMKYPDEMEDCSFIRILENTIVETTMHDSTNKHLEDHGKVSVEDLEVCPLERKK